MRVDGASMVFDVRLSDRTVAATTITDIRFPMLSEHNVQNCRGNCCGAEINIKSMPFKALATFGGVGRRFETKGISERQSLMITGITQ